MPLTPLTLAHGSALTAFLDAFERAEEGSIPGYFLGRDVPHPTVVRTLEAWSHGLDLRDGWVPCTTTFLEVGGELVGLFNFRHHLTEPLQRHGGHVGYSVRPDRRGRGHAQTLLRGAMALGAARGLATLVLTTDAHNLPSQRVIARCGGVVQSRYPDPVAPDRTSLRWFLPLTPEGAGPAVPLPG